MFAFRNSTENDLNSFINTSRIERVQSMTTDSPRVTNYYPPPTNFETQSETNFNTIRPVRSYSPNDLQKLKYKIDLDKQVAEKKQRQVQEWESKIERERKYVRHQPFGRHENTTVINKNELEEILYKGRAPSPVLDMPQQLPHNYPPSQTMNEKNPYASASYSSIQTKPESPPKNSNKNDANFHHFYGPLNGANGSTKHSATSSGSTTQPIKGDAHDPFMLFDPNKEGQNVFNIIPQQDLYDPWGRPGGGAPLVHPPTGQKFTRYSGSLQEKLDTPGPLGFYRRQYSGNIEEQKHALEAEQQRRQQEDREHRSNAGDTAQWISQIESSRYPLKLHLPTTRTTREYIGARDPYQIHESRILHSHLVEQAEERTRLQKINRYQNNIAELQHTEAQNNWWGRGGGGAPTYTNRRHNVQNTLEHPRQKWTTNHLGQMIMTDDEPPDQLKIYKTDFFFPKTSRNSNHRNFYEISNNQNS